MKVDLYNQKGEKKGDIELPEGLFNVEINQDLLLQTVQTQLANSREPIAHTKDRGEARGGGRKPWRQKGTGRARHGSIRSPIWKGGGVTFGPRKEKVYTKKINKKAKRKALFMALGSKLNDSELMIVDSIKLENVKTKEMSDILNNLSEKLKGYKKGKDGKFDNKKRDKILFVIPSSNKDITKATNNLQFTSLIRADSLNVVDILKYKYLLILKDSLEVMRKTYKSPSD